MAWWCSLGLRESQMLEDIIGLNGYTKVQLVSTCSNKQSPLYVKLDKGSTTTESYIKLQ